MSFTNNITVAQAEIEGQQKVKTGLSAV